MTTSERNRRASRGDGGRGKAGSGGGGGGGKGYGKGSGGGGGGGGNGGTSGDGAYTVRASVWLPASFATSAPEGGVRLRLRAPSH